MLRSRMTPLISLAGAASCARVFLVVLLLLMTPVLLWASTGEMRSLALSGQVRAEIRSDGSLSLIAVADLPALLTGQLNTPGEVPRLRGRPVEITSWLGQSFEGAVGGLRGFSSRADDDGDGLVDEDPLDGQDNDGDGRWDEDFGAISDAMTTVYLAGAGASLQLEYFHWRDVRLQGAVMISLPPHESSDLLGDSYVIDSGADSWREVPLSFPRHTLSGKLEIMRGAALVAMDRSSGLWLGIADFGAQATDGAAAYVSRPVLDGTRLSFGLSETRRYLSICVAESRLQLERLLLEGGRIFRGVSDPATGRQVPWIVGPACTICRQGDLPVLSWREDGAGQVALVAQVGQGGPGFMDPDLLRLNGRPLAGPVTIAWHPVDGQVVEQTWSTGLTSTGSWPSPYQGMDGLLAHSSAGQLIMTLPLTVKELEDRLRETAEDPLLAGFWLDGRPFNLPVPTVITGVPAVTEQVTPDDDPTDPDDSVDPSADQAPLVLSLSLLEGWPNPFREVIQVRFRVPATVGEAFDWSEKENIPDEGALQAPVKWPSGQPNASVKIYSVNGQELVILHEGSLGDGQYTAQWNGTDSYGRKVASGTYFCKLQLDDWSVTKRVVFLR